MNDIKFSIIIVDDFKNVLIAQTGKGKKTIKTWNIFSKEIKNINNMEKEIFKFIDRQLKCSLFDLKLFKEIDNENEKNYIFTSTVKEYITTHREINCIKWISKNDIENYNFNDVDKKVLKEFFN